jgi:hypothetical protein
LLFHREWLAQPGERLPWQPNGFSVAMRKAVSTFGSRDWPSAIAVGRCIVAPLLTNYTKTGGKMAEQGMRTAMIGRRGLLRLGADT